MDAYQFFLLAIRESDCPDRARGLNDLASIAVMGAIGQGAGTRDEFIRGGFSFLDGFSESVKVNSEVLLENACDDPQKRREAKEIIAILKGWEKGVKSISLADYFLSLASDWDQRHD